MKDPKNDSTPVLERFGRDKRKRTVVATAERVERRPRLQRDAADSEQPSFENRPERRASYNPHFTADNRPVFEKPHYGDKSRGEGDGFTQKTPRHVLMFDHALDVLAAEGLSFGKARIVSRTVEFVPLVVPYVVEGKKRKGFYFDFSRVYWNKPEGYTYQRDRTWQFNNLKPRTYK